MANIIINTTAVRNNGDVALIFALEAALITRGHSVKFATPHPDILLHVQGRKNACKEVLGYGFKIFQNRFFSDLSALALLLFSSAYRRSDIIIGAPGGYINSYYGFTWRRAIYRWAHRLGKKTAIYAQSVGPLNEIDRQGLHLFSQNIDILMTRDELSERTARSVGFSSDRLIASIDGFFLSQPHTSATSSSSKIVAISVREWRHDGRNVDLYVDMISQLTEALLRRGFSIDFLSTCQGIKNYIDDSQIAASIASNLQLKHGKAIPVSVIPHSFSLDELKSRLSNYRMVVGTRLHMCLLALMSGVPAFNISYESKGRECYQYLGLQDCSIDYCTDPTTAIQQFTEFLDNESNIRKQLPSLMKNSHQRALEDFELFATRLGL